jgi:hypothetical protein
MPDWDESKAVRLVNGSVVAADGWIVFRVDDTTVMDNSYQARAFINGVEVYYWGWEHFDGDNNTNTVNVPVCKGDVLTHTDVSGRMSCTFYPVKMTRTEYPDKMIVPNWSGDGTAIASGSKIPSDGWIRCYSDPAGNNTSLTRTVYVNGVLVARFQQWDADSTDSMDFQPAVVPVAKNDVVTHSCSVAFFPAKPATTVASEADILEEKINKNATDIVALSASAEDLERRATENATAIASNASAIEANTAEIESLKTSGGLCIVSLDVNDTNEGFLNPIMVRSGNKIMNLPTVTKTGERFSHWINVDTNEIVTGSTVVTSDIHLWPVFIVEEVEFMSYSGNASPQGVAAEATLSYDSTLVYNWTSTYASHSVGGSKLQYIRGEETVVIKSVGRGGSASGEIALQSGDIVQFIVGDGKGSGYSTYNFSATLIG